ncbi:LLM class F420-dependent oxidoreductase [Rhodococcus sp. WMMA185]|uniref:LLM class F420-dependent oxidoreductase n=1 Tax=Rhodococcus sp. WMMA185 TaxID=679318 RepID=UPI000878F019|nr:LLM class F420-dependent oxidoreductase [Rhodococcus sp. WMMA185]AOW92153.1 LLM class F420-dependent oxidoreductase [Rhodococcus sp. WMMA185]
MMISDKTPDLGRLGAFELDHAFSPDMARECEQLGYGTLWLSGSPPADLKSSEAVLEATERVTVATGITNICNAPAAEVAKSFHRLEARFPGRFLLGLGVGHPEDFGQKYSGPFESMTRYLDELDTAGVPVSRRMLAALGPRMLRLSAERSCGAHPAFVTARHTREARKIIGPDSILAPEHKVLLDTDLETARQLGRQACKMYLHLQNYRTNLMRLGFSPEELDHGGSDRLIDALVVYGSTDSIIARLEEHFTAGADHLTIQPVSADRNPMPTFRLVAGAFGVNKKS